MQIDVQTPIAGTHRARLLLKAGCVEVLRIRLHSTSREGDRGRDVIVAVTHPGAAHHDLDALWLTRGAEPDSIELEWHCVLAKDEFLTHITVAPLDFQLRETTVPQDMRLDLNQCEFEPLASLVSRARFAPQRVAGLSPAGKRRDGKRDAVVFAWWVPDHPEAAKVAEYYLGLLRYHHFDSKIFVGINHGSDPAWIEVIGASGLDIEVSEARAEINVSSDVGGFLSALEALNRSPETFDLVWFGHTKGASKPTYAEYVPYRFQHDRKLWSRREDVDRLFDDPIIGLFSHRYGLCDANPSVPWHGTGEVEALQRIYREKYAPLGLWAWETVFVSRDSVIRRFLTAVGDSFFRTDPARYGAGRYWFEAAFPSIATMQGLEPFIELDTDGPGSDRNDALLGHDPKQGNRLAMEELQRWRDDPYHFKPRMLWKR